MKRISLLFAVIALLLPLVFTPGHALMAKKSASSAATVIARAPKRVSLSPLASGSGGVEQKRASERSARDRDKNPAGEASKFSSEEDMMSSMEENLLASPAGFLSRS